MIEKIRRGWQNWRFDQMAYMVNDRIDNPTEADVSYYVGLEHLDSESLSIRRWGSPTDVEATKLRFRKGDIIFGRRRVYQRKLAVAHFDGICSAHAMVLRAKPDVVLPEFLPFFMQSDLFMERAKEISVGSLSPTINWKTLAEEKFDLPPMEEQKRIVNVLLAMLRYENSYRSLSTTTSRILKVITERLCWNKEWQLQPVVNIADPIIGRFLDGDWIETKDQSNEGIRLLQLADIGEGVFLNKSKRYISNDTFLRLGCTEVLTDDLLVARMAEPIGRTCVIPPLETRCITAVDCCIVRINKAKHDLRYWLFVMNSPSWTRLIESAAAGSTRSRISRRNLEAIMVPVPNRDNQIAIAERLVTIKNAITEAEGRATTMQKMAHDIITTNLGGAVI